MEHIPITHAPQGAGSRISAGQRPFRTQPHLYHDRRPPRAVLHGPHDAASLLIRPVRPRAMMTAAGMAPGRTPPPPLRTAACRGSPVRSLLPCHKKRPPSRGRRSFFAFGLPCPPRGSGLSACLLCPAIRAQAQTATYFFRASESTMAWAWASSTFPASRTSTCRSAPRASTPRMGMFPAWPCIS